MGASEATENKYLFIGNYSMIIFNRLMANAIGGNFPTILD